MFGLEKFAALASPEMSELIESLPQKVADWSKFLTDLSMSQERVENNLALVYEQNDDIKQKLLLLMSVSNITPELQHEVEAMAAVDPRNHSVGSVINEPVQ